MVISTEPQILALDFDGVICDGVLEYFQTTKRTYTQIWSDSSSCDLEAWAEPFYCLRPVIETGWEMPVLLRALVLGYKDQQIEADWSTLCQQILQSDNLKKQDLATGLDGVRDHWIDTDLDGWLQLHRFYPGVINRIRQILETSTIFYIVTTKEGRFVQQLLEKQGLELPRNQILGKEVKQPKYETLRQLLQEHSRVAEQLWFVEDLLKTLQSVRQQTDLDSVQLFLADWGYNTQKSQELAQEIPQINLLSLNTFNQDFSLWIN